MIRLMQTCCLFLSLSLLSVNLGFCIYSFSMGPNVVSIFSVCSGIVKVYKNVSGCIRKMVFPLLILINQMPCTNHLGSNTLGHLLLRWGHVLSFCVRRYLLLCFYLKQKFYVQLVMLKNSPFPPQFESLFLPLNPPCPLILEHLGQWNSVKAIYYQENFVECILRWSMPAS